jgi:hypothetical protein
MRLFSVPSATHTHTYIYIYIYIKIKKDIEELNDNECLNKLLLLKPCKYRYIDEADDSENFDAVKKVHGFIAEEVKEFCLRR